MDRYWSRGWRKCIARSAAQNRPGAVVRAAVRDEGKGEVSVRFVTKDKGRLSLSGDRSSSLFELISRILDLPVAAQPSPGIQTAPAPTPEALAAPKSGSPTVSDFLTVGSRVRLKSTALGRRVEGRIAALDASNVTIDGGAVSR